MNREQPGVRGRMAVGPKVTQGPVSPRRRPDGWVRFLRAGPLGRTAWHAAREAAPSRMDVDKHPIAQTPE